MKSKIAVLLAMAVILAAFSIANAVMPGDVNGNGSIELQDAVAALQAAAGMNPAGISSGADVNKDGKIGIEEAVFALRTLASLGIGRGQAVLGPLAGASVKVYRITDLNNPVYTATTDANGYFDAALISPNGDEYLLVTVSGGQDIDADDDGVTNAQPTPNTGTICALMTVSQLNAGNFKVSAITDLVWQYVKNLIGQVDAEGLKLRFKELAINFFGQNADLNGDGVVDERDICIFDPRNPDHKAKLNFDYKSLFAQNTDGNSIIGCYHNNLANILPVLLDAMFGDRLTRYPSADIRYKKIKIAVTASGQGSVNSSNDEISIDSARVYPLDNKTAAFFTQSAADKITLTAAPTSETQILAWNGCDTVSADKTTCECGLVTDRLVSVTFGYKEAKLKDGVTVVDLSNAVALFGADQVAFDITAGVGDTDTMAKLAALKAGDVVVGGSNGGFFRKVISIQKISDSHYTLTTGDVRLDEVIAQGTGHFYKQMTYGDLAPQGFTRSVRTAGESGNVRLLPSDDPKNSVFSFQIGDSGNETREIIQSESGELKWSNSNGVSVSAKGKVDVTVDVETGLSLGLFGVENFKFIPKIVADESLDVTFGGELKLVDSGLEVEIGTLHFVPISFPVGIILVWVEPIVTITLGLEANVGGEITTGIKLKQTARAGIVYSRGAGINTVKEFTPSFEFNPPTMNSYAEVKPYMTIEPVLDIYSVTGPALSLEGYLKLKGELKSTVFTDDICSGGLSVSAFAGFDASLKWELDKLKKLFNWKDANLEFTFYEKEILLKKWNVLGVCGTRPPFMKVEGTDVNGSAAYHSGTVLNTTYTITNTGDLEMDWNLSYYEDGATTVTPTSGSLTKDQSVSVDVSVNTDKLAVGTYKNRIEFVNPYNEDKERVGLFSAVPTGSTSRSIRVIVLNSSAAPVLSQPVMAADSTGKTIPTIVNLSWSYPSMSLVQGYSIFISTNPSDSTSWRKLATITKPDVSSYQAANLQTDTTYSFRMSAFSQAGDGPVSGIVTIRTPPAPIGGQTFTNSLGMVFRLIPAGTFMMGSPLDEPGRYSDEVQHQVTISKSFFMMATHVTQAQWQSVMGSNPPSYLEYCGGNCPIEKVSWNDVQSFITKLNQRGEGTYRLPTEAEWEYAARGGSVTAFYNGGIAYADDSWGMDNNLDAIGWYCNNSCVSSPGYVSCGIHPVAQKQANAYGLYDMSGNVWQWVLDWYGSYPIGSVTDPTGPITGSNRVLRGGSWHDNARDCRSANRYYDLPSGGVSSIGFRLVRSAGQ